jgi:diamine N-acetyltransferase
MTNFKISIRALEPEDLDLLYKIENDMSIWNIGTNNVPYSKYLLHDYIAANSGDIYSDKQVRLIIELNKNIPVGIIDLVNFDPQNRRAEVGIAILAEYQNNGYGESALNLIEEYSSNVIHIHQLYAFIDTNNIQSLKLFKKAGYSNGQTLKEWTFDGKKYHNAIIMQRFLEKSL